ncbi:MAG: bifunctional heptose 7-phosphate kinase/heptose 1-phosphate adenyltransferase [Planctomycetes bacterium]|nr:bifunctional heptose 7-phosphate kinase/heptose 1-phosphate adenyltransferase [Planctomycetota bacterium]
MSNHLVELIQSLGTPRLLVLGDAILDRYIWGDAERVSQEAPVILLRADRDEVRLGGAANVANMVRGLRAEVTLATVVGSDTNAIVLHHELERAGISADAVVADSTRPTTVKERFIGRAQNRHPHQMLRVDRETREPVSDEIATALLAKILPAIADHQAILVSDYGKGVCTPHVVQQVIAAARAAGVPVIVDPRPGSDYSLYRHATAVTPNRLETRLATGREIRTTDDAFAAGRQLCQQVKLDHAYVTLDSDGIALVMADGSAQHLPTRKRQVYDITGAGDMVLATIGVGMAAAIPPADIARLANVAGGLEVERVGVVPITREEMLADILANSRGAHEKVCSLDELEKQLVARRTLGQRIVFTNGCFDILHAGHVAYLQQAAAEGDCLIVGLNSDASVRKLNKGPERPVIGQEHRAAMLAAMEAVEYVVVFDEVTPHKLLERLRPDLLVKGGTYQRHEIVGWELVERYGGEVKPLGEIPGLSTSRIVEKLREPYRKAG